MSILSLLRLHFSYTVRLWAICHCISVVFTHTDVSFLSMTSFGQTFFCYIIQWVSFLVVGNAANGVDESTLWSLANPFAWMILFLFLLSELSKTPNFKAVLPSAWSGTGIYTSPPHWVFNQLPLWHFNEKWYDLMIWWMIC